MKPSCRNLRRHPLFVKHHAVFAAAFLFQQENRLYLLRFIHKECIPAQLLPAENPVCSIPVVKRLSLIQLYLCRHFHPAFLPAAGFFKRFHQPCTAFFGVLCNARFFYRPQIPVQQRFELFFTVIHLHFRRLDMLCAADFPQPCQLHRCQFFPGVQPPDWIFLHFAKFISLILHGTVRPLS